MTFPSLKALGLVTTIFAGAANAAPITQDFETIPTGTFNGPVVFDDGMTITSTFDDRFRGDVIGGTRSLGSTAFAADEFLIAVEDGSDFMFGGLDVMNRIGDIVDGYLLFDYVEADGNTGSLSFDIVDIIGNFTHIDAFENPLSSMTIFSNTAFNIDNLTYDIIADDQMGGGDTVSVPEPGTLGILALGLAGLAATRRFGQPKAPTV